MSTSRGWKANKEARRPHSKARLKKRPPRTRVSKRRRTSLQDRNQALRLKGLL